MVTCLPLSSDDAKRRKARVVFALLYCMFATATLGSSVLLLAAAVHVH